MPGAVVVDEDGGIVGYSAVFDCFECGKRMPYDGPQNEQVERTHLSVVRDPERPEGTLREPGVLGDRIISKSTFMPHP
jgi:hypothetical protein